MWEDASKGAEKDMETQEGLAGSNKCQEPEACLQWCQQAVGMKNGKTRSPREPKPPRHLCACACAYVYMYVVHSHTHAPLCVCRDVHLYVYACMWRPKDNQPGVSFLRTIPTLGFFFSGGGVMIVF